MFASGAGAVVVDVMVTGMCICLSSLNCYQIGSVGIGERCFLKSKLAFYQKKGEWMPAK